MCPLYIEVDFDLVEGNALAGRRVGDVEVRRSELRQAELLRKCVCVRLNRKGTAPVDDGNGLTLAVVAFVVQARQIVGSLDFGGRVATARAGLALQIQFVARVSADRQLAVTVGGKRLLLRARETL